jgi:cell volume regulation protein A
LFIGQDSFDYILLISSFLLLASLMASKISMKLGIPSLLVYLAIGMLAGSEGFGGIEFDNYGVAKATGIVALIFILFSGGLDTKWENIKPILLQGLSLSTIGVVITALLVGIFTSYVAHFSLVEGMLLGVIVSSTDAAAVFSILRSSNLKLNKNIRSLLELESGSNDPMSVFLTLGLIYILHNPNSVPFPNLFYMFLSQMIIGAILGIGLGKLSIIAINHLKFEYSGLYQVFTITIVLFIYSATSVLGGSGFLAIYLAGIILGNSGISNYKVSDKFHDGLAWLMQISMFLTLGLLVFPTRLIPVMNTGLVIALFLIIIARPVAVYITLAFSGLKKREKAFISWVGLRGAVPVVLAIFPLIAGINKSETIFNLVFFIVLTSSVLQGTSINLVSRYLKVGNSGQENKQVIADS